jgi:hypothetical protein
MVHTRSIEAWPVVLAHRYLDPHILHIPVQPRGPTLAIVTFHDERNATACEQSWYGG